MDSGKRMRSFKLTTVSRITTDNGHFDITTISISQNGGPVKTNIHVDHSGYYNGTSHSVQLISAYIEWLD